MASKKQTREFERRSGPGSHFETPGSILGLILAIFVVFLVRLESHWIAQSTAKILDGMLENAGGLCKKSSINSGDALGRMQ